MHYDGKGAHTLMALNGPEVATRRVDEDMATSAEVVALHHPPTCMLTHASNASPTHSSALL